MLKLMKEFTSAFSVSGWERPLAELIKKELSAVADDVQTDALGNLMVLKKGKDSSKRLMIASHMDEVGFVVTHVDESGYVHVSSVGWINPIAACFGKVRFANGTEGVLVVRSGTKPDAVEAKTLLVDIGAPDKKTAEKKVGVGDLCAPAPFFQRLTGSRYAAKAFDDRIGCAISAYAALHCEQPAYDTWFVFTVQEETDYRGALPAAYRIAPDYGIVLDVTAADECGTAIPVTRLGKGAAIKIKDSSLLCAPKIIDRLTELAERGKIPYQYEVFDDGGTDASSMQKAGAGCLAGGISVPARYVHSPVETLDKKDLDACAKLLISLIENGME